MAFGLSQTILLPSGFWTNNSEEPPNSLNHFDDFFGEWLIAVFFHCQKDRLHSQAVLYVFDGDEGRVLRFSSIIVGFFSAHTFKKSRELVGNPKFFTIPDKGVFGILSFRVLFGSVYGGGGLL